MPGVGVPQKSKHSRMKWDELMNAAKGLFETTLRNLIGQEETEDSLSFR